MSSRHINTSRLQLRISRESPDQVIDGWLYFGYTPREGESDVDMGRRHVKEFSNCYAARDSLNRTHVRCFPIHWGLLRLEPYSEGLRDRIWCGADSNATSVWAARLGMNLRSSTLKFDETGEPFHIQQAPDSCLSRRLENGWPLSHPRVSVSRSIFALIDDRERAYFGRGGQEQDKIGFMTETDRWSSGVGYAAEPDALIEELRKDAAITETVPNKLGVAYNAHVLEAILTTVAPALGWR